jgi:hypothetical protein
MQNLMNKFNKVLKVKAYPKEWKMPIVCLIYKNKEKVDLA